MRSYEDGPLDSVPSLSLLPTLTVSDLGELGDRDADLSLEEGSK